jgi:transcription antitermination factor NusG
VDRLLHRETAERPRTQAQFSIGESVKVISGPLSDFSGEIAEINEDAANSRCWSRSSVARPRSRSATTRSRRL